jgi:hypothetical protein
MTIYDAFNYQENEHEKPTKPVRAKTSRPEKTVAPASHE